MVCDEVYSVVTDLTVSFCSSNNRPQALDPRRWHRIEKDLYLHTMLRSAWLYITQAIEEDLTADSLVVTDISIGGLNPTVGANSSWESRPGGIWVLRSKYRGDKNQAVTGLDLLFGIDAVDPRPQWNLLRAPLQVNAPKDLPVSRLSVRYGRAKSGSNRFNTPLRVRPDGKYKMVQISDTHMVTGVGVCNDAIDTHGQPLPQSEADPLTVKFVGTILDIEKPDLVILTGDQLHHDNLDSQSALFKVVAPLIERSISYAIVFGNHDSEGDYALSRK